MERVRGRCPACGDRGTLHVARDSAITCDRTQCPDPGKVAALLDRPPYHVLQMDETGWALEHEVTCFPNLLDCDMHRKVSAWMATIPSAQGTVGRFRITPLDFNGHFELEPVDHAPGLPEFGVRPTT